MKDQRCIEICAGCTAACPPPGVECPFLKDAEERIEGALPPMMLDENVRIDRAVDTDAFGITYEGFDGQTGKPVIIREYFPYGFRMEDHSIDPIGRLAECEFEEGIPRVARKLKQLSRLRHPGFARCYAVIGENNTLYALYEPVQGRTLGQLWQTIPTIGVQQAAVLFAPAADALLKILENGIVPDEINPDNIVVKDEDSRCTIIHMGSTFSWDDETNLYLKTSGPLPPTADAWHLPMLGMAGETPETIAQYSLAALLCRWLTGKEAPGKRETGWWTESDFPASVPEAVQKVLRKSLQYNPSSRYASLREMWEAFCREVQAAPAAVTVPRMETECPPTLPPQEAAPVPAKPEIQGALKAGTRIRGAITVLECLGRFPFGYRYLAEENGQKVILSEFMLRHWCSRAEDGVSIAVKDCDKTIYEENKSLKKQQLIRRMKILHPGMTRITSIFEENNTFYTAEEYAEGCTLTQLWENPTCTPDDVWSPAELLPRFTPAVQALIQLRRHNLLELITPDYFLMESAAGQIRLVNIGTLYPGKITTFYSEHTSAHLPPGATEWYCAPEVMKEYLSIDHAAQYTLCAILYRMMSASEPPAWNDRIWKAGRQLQPLNEFSAVSDVICRGLSLNPQERYASMEELWQAFEAAVGPVPQTTYKPEIRQRCHCCMEKLGSDSVCPHCGHDHAETLQLGIALPGVLLAGRYRTGQSLGRGEDYMTYIGYDELMDQKVAIREYFPAGKAYRAENGIDVRIGDGQDEEASRQFSQKRRENIALIKDGRTAGVEAMYDLFDENGTFYVIKEYVGGSTFEEWLKGQKTFLTLEEAESVLRPAAENLLRLHEKGMAHGDICPQNLMVDADGRNSVWIDRTSVCRYNREEDKSSQPRFSHRRAFCTLEGWKPENDVPAALSDEYAFCAVLYYVLTGKPPAEASMRMLGVEPLKSICEINPTVSPAVEQVIFKGMELEAENRYPSMQEWLTAMESACASSRDSGKKTSLWQKLGFHKGKK